MKTYMELMAAIKILAGAEQEAVREMGTAFNNPAWTKLHHATTYLTKQAAAILSDPTVA